MNGAEYGTFDDLMLPIGEGLKAMERLCSSAHWTNRRSLLTLPEGLSMGLFSFLSLRFGLTERSIFFSSTADVFVKAVSRFWSAVYALLVYWWPFLFPPFEYSVKKKIDHVEDALLVSFFFFPLQPCVIWLGDILTGTRIGELRRPRSIGQRVSSWELWKIKWNKCTGTGISSKVINILEFISNGLQNDFDL